MSFDYTNKHATRGGEGHKDNWSKWRVQTGWMKNMGPVWKSEACSSSRI